MSRGAPAGWYADPGVPGQLRWWDGSEWAPDTVAPAEPSDPSAPAGTREPTDPADEAGAADAADVIERSAANPAPAPGRQPEAPRPSSAGARTRTRTNTVWVWLAIVFSVFPLCSALLIDAITSAQLIGYFTLPAGFDPGPRGWVLGGLLLLAFVNGLSLAASVLFAWLDARSLRRRGVEKPFGWGWSALVFVATLAVYIVGRTVVVRRATGGGFAPLWGWLIGLLVGLIALVLWLSAFVDSLATLMVAG